MHGAMIKINLKNVFENYLLSGRHWLNKFPEIQTYYFYYIIHPRNPAKLITGSCFALSSFSTLKV
jgi:hypothetical protein